MGIHDLRSHPIRVAIATVALVAAAMTLYWITDDAEPGDSRIEAGPSTTTERDHRSPTTTRPDPSIPEPPDTGGEPTPPPGDDEADSGDEPGGDRRTPPGDDEGGNDPAAPEAPDVPSPPAPTPWDTTTTTTTTTTSTSTTTTLPKPPGHLDECPGLSPAALTEVVGGGWVFDWGVASYGSGVAVAETWDVYCFFTSTEPPPAGSSVVDSIQVTLTATVSPEDGDLEYDERLKLYANGDEPLPIDDLGDEAHRLHDEMITVRNGAEMAAVFYNSTDASRPGPLIEPLARFVESLYWPG